MIYKIDQNFRITKASEGLDLSTHEEYEKTLISGFVVKAYKSIKTGKWAFVEGREDLIGQPALFAQQDYKFYTVSKDMSLNLASKQATPEGYEWTDDGFIKGTPLRDGIEVGRCLITRKIEYVRCRIECINLRSHVLSYE